MSQKTKFLKREQSRIQAVDDWDYRKGEIKEKFIRKYVNTISPIDTANIFQRIFFSWVNPIMKVSQKIAFDSDMVFKIQEKRDSSVEIVKFSANFRKNCENSKE